MTSTGGIQIRLGDLIYGILKRWKMILLLTFIGLVFGVLISAFTYMQGSYSNYQIDASFVVMTKNDEDNFTSYGTAFQHPNDYDFATNMVETVNYVIKSDTNMNRAIDSLRIIDIKPQDIAQNLDLSVYGATAIVEVTFTWRDAKEGIKILNAVLDAAQKTLPETLRVGKLSIIDPPAARQSLAGTVGGSIWGYMTILGFLAGVGYVALEILMRPTLTNLSDMENLLGLESLGVIPKDKKYFREKKSLLVNDDVISFGVTQNFASTAFILKNRLKPDKGPHCFYVTSTITGEGKTTVAANLAVQLSDMECKVLLLDMNSRNPTLGKLFLDHVEYDRSFNALYKGDATILDSVYTLTGYLDLLPMVLDRQPIPMEGTVFDLIKEIEKNYDYVIIDTAPVGHYSDVLSLNAIADTVLFVVGYDAATIPEIASAVEKLDKSGIRILGSVVNNVQNLAGMARNDESEDRKKQLLRDRKREPLAWEKTMESGKSKKEKGQKKKNSKKKRKKEDRKNSAKQKGFFGKGKSKKAQARVADETNSENMDMPPVVDTDESSREKTVRRNPIYDLMDEDVKTVSSAISDNDAREALFKIGMNGDFVEAELESASEAGDHALFEMFVKEAGLSVNPEAETGTLPAGESETVTLPAGNLETVTLPAEDLETATLPAEDLETATLPAGDPEPEPVGEEAESESASEAGDHALFEMFKKEAGLGEKTEAESSNDTKEHALFAMFMKEAGFSVKGESEAVILPAGDPEPEGNLAGDPEPEGNLAGEAGAEEAKPAIDMSDQDLFAMFKKEAELIAKAESEAEVELTGGSKTEVEAESTAESEAEAESERKSKTEAEAESRRKSKTEAVVDSKRKPEQETESKEKTEADDVEEDDYESIRDTMMFYF